MSFLHVLFRAFPLFRPAGIPFVSLSRNLWNFTFRPSNLLHLHSLLATAVYQEFPEGEGEKLFEKNLRKEQGKYGRKRNKVSHSSLALFGAGKNE